MKKIILLLASFTLCSISFAQLSEGGEPESFHNTLFTSLAPVPFINMPSFNLAALRSADSIDDQSKLAYRFGFNHFVDLGLNNSGVWNTSSSGDKIWQLGITSKNAMSINLTFDDYELPEGATLFIYTTDKKFVLGAFTNKNNDASKKFATDLIPRDSIIIEYDEPAQVAGIVKLHLYRVTHGYRGVNDFISTRSFGGSGACQVNVNCPLGDLWQHEKRGIICLVVGGNEFCSASLVNDVPQDGIPYVLTANHCSGDEASWVFRFNWEAPACSDPPSNPASQSLSGGILKAKSDTSDFCLVEITGGLAGGTIPSSYLPYFNGWSNADVPADSIIGIHHPSGDIKKISAATNPTTSHFYDGVQCWKIGQWTTGCTESGSSGSPIFDQDHHIVGQLYDGPSACNQSPNLMYDYYGKFSVSWLGTGTNETQLKHWLDPDNTGAVMIDGYDGALNSSASTNSKDQFSTIFPNPNDGNFEVSVPSGYSQDVQLQLLDASGRTIQSQPLINYAAGKVEFQFRNLPPGIYFIREQEKEKTRIDKVVVIRQ